MEETHESVEIKKKKKKTFKKKHSNTNEAVENSVLNGASTSGLRNDNMMSTTHPQAPRRQRQRVASSSSNAFPSGPNRRFTANPEVNNGSTRSVHDASQAHENTEVVDQQKKRKRKPRKRNVNPPAVSDASTSTATESPVVYPVVRTDNVNNRGPRYQPAKANPMNVPRQNRMPARPRPFKKVDLNSMTFREKLIYQLENDRYECMICFRNVTSRQKVWSCKECHHVFHISGKCILNWATKSMEDTGFWNCPACKAQYSQVPEYFCYCGKVRNPQTKVGDRPHACEGLCLAKKGEDCIHPCNEPCHPGPCLDCEVYVIKTCPCGGTSKFVRCKGAVECSKTCGKLLACGNHKCEKICHFKDCGPCEVKVEQTCFCGTDKRVLDCGPGVTADEKFDCGRSCSGYFSCGIHQCDKKCHNLSSGCGSCPTAVSRISHCPCGKMSLKEANVVRTSCEEPIPTCSNICNKVLACGNSKHRCVDKCHEGECKPCQDITSILCRCKRITELMPCSEIPSRTNEFNQFLCNVKCQKRSSCGIHRCTEICCVSTDHTCLRPCRKRLSCGLHFCEYLCHSGQCRPCLNASFTEQYCECGKTVRLPPIACGQPPPQCDGICRRSHSCSHPVMHPCHTEENCPPCTVLTEKMCYGGHETRKNIQCHFSGVSCGKVCGKPLPCGIHSCNRNCHPGECFVEGAQCVRPCPEVRRSCEHACAVPCHTGQECPETKCTQMIPVTCPCGRRKGDMRCHDMIASIMRIKAASAQDNEGTNISEENPNPGVLTRSLSVENLTCISCNDDCKKLARNKKLADALSIVTDLDGLTDEPTVTFTEALKEEFRKNPHFVMEVEAIFCSLAKKFSDVTISDALSHSFRPMPIDRRRFIHSYSELFSMTTLSVDDPPKRSVIVTARRSTSRIPLILLSDLQKYPTVLKNSGIVTLKQNPNNEEVKVTAPPVEKGMQQLKAKCKVFKRVPYEIAKPEPLKQHNSFSVLCSDDEELERNVVEHRKPQKVCDWWNDDEDVMRKNDAEQIAELLSDCVDRISLSLGQE